jgi:copper chaperone CopZ
MQAKEFFVQSHNVKRARKSAMRHRSKREIQAGAWGLVAGVVGGLCCIGPSAAILLGLGASSALLGFTLDRALTLGGGATLLLAGELLLARRGRVCDLRPAARWRTLALMLASFALAYGLLGLLAPALAARQEDAAADAARAASQRQSLSVSKEQPAVAAAPSRRLMLVIEKMECPPCAATVRTALKRQPAVRAFVAEVYNDQVTIDYDSGQTSAKKLVALFPPRYGVTLISDAAIP